MTFYQRRSPHEMPGCSNDNCIVYIPDVRVDGYFEDLFQGFLWHITFPTVVKRVPTCVRNINNDVTLKLCSVV